MTQKKRSNEGLTPDRSVLQWIRLALAYLLIPLALLLSAGDLHWWNAWLYSLILLSVGMGGRILAEQRHPGLNAERQSREALAQAKSWDKLLAPMMAVSFGFPVVILSGLDHRFAWSADFSTGVTLVGFVSVAGGYLFASWALIENRFFSTVVRIQTERGHQVCETGPYRFVRHPGYAGNILALFGTVIALNALWALIPALLATLIALIRTELEDQTLQQELPGYTAYSEQVRFRLFPGLY